MAELFIRHAGSRANPPLVLVHGVTDDGGCWPDAVARWEPNWHVVAVDLRGHGYSPPFTDEQLSRAPDALLEDVVGVLEEQASAVVVAHSLGALLALRAAVARPELVRALVLEDPSNPTSRTAPDPERASGLEDMIAQAATDLQTTTQRLGIAGRWSNTEIQGWAAAKNRVDPRYLREGFWFGDGAWEELFNQVRCPTLVVGPEGGAMLPDPLAVSNPHVRIETVAGAGHCVRRDEPQAFHRLVDPFLAALRKTVA